MGRPLNKKYFGNRNIGTGGDQITGNLSNSQNYSDDRIGGEGVASYGTIVAGSGWTTAPTVTFSAPTFPGGVSVAGTVHYKALSFATTANGTGYAVGDVVEVHTGTATTKARATVARVVTVGTPTVNDGGSLYDVSGEVGDRVTFTNAGLSTPLIVEITAVSGSTATAVEVVQAGIWSGAGAPTTTTGWTATTSDGPTDNNGTGLVLNLTWGAYSFSTPTVAGDYTVFPSTGASGTLDSVAPATGTGAKADITMGLLSINVTEKGSGYFDAADAAVSFTGATGAGATAVLTTDSGAIGSATYQENAIVAYAQTTSDGSNQVGDIIKQVSGRRYKVKTADGIAVCELVTDGVANAAGEMTITATDANGNTYYVAKLTARRATLVQLTDDGADGDWVYASNESAPWSFDAATGVYVQIANK